MLCQVRLSRRAPLDRPPTAAPLAPTAAPLGLPRLRRTTKRYGHDKPPPLRPRTVPQRQARPGPAAPPPGTSPGTAVPSRPWPSPVATAAARFRGPRRLATPSRRRALQAAGTRAQGLLARIALLGVRPLLLVLREGSSVIAAWV